MAQKRMFDKRVIDSDNFLEMPLSTQAVYFHLNMRADDDGFVDNWKSILRLIGGKEDDLKVLISKKFVIPFEKGVIVIKHWKLNNVLRKDRYIETIHQDEKKCLITEENGEYSLGIPNGNQMATQYSRVENSIEKNSIDNIYSPANAELCEVLPATTNQSTTTNLFKEIIDYLNLKTGSDYKYTTKSTQSKINARLNEGFKLDDFKVVIDKKCAEWLNTDMQIYLRPETLFGTKFESYLNQIRPKKNEKLPHWFNKNIEKKEENIGELKEILKDFE